jgi:cyclohexyl-isocyanide hydratase
MHWRIRPGCRRIAQGAAGNDALGFCRSVASRRGYAREGRVVKDGNVITAAGVSSGIDLGFIVAAEIAGEATARAIQLGIEYDPAPPFDSGNPDRASAAIKSAVLAEGYDDSMSAYRAGIDRATRL